MLCSGPLLHSCAGTHIRPYSTAVRWSVYCRSLQIWERRHSTWGCLKYGGARRLRHPVHAILFGTSPSATLRLHLRRRRVLSDFLRRHTPTDPKCCARTLSAVLLGALLWLRPSVGFRFSYCPWTSTTPPCAASRGHSLPCPPRRHPGKGEGYTELEGVEDDDALLVPIVPCGAERPSLPCPALS